MSQHFKDLFKGEETEKYQVLKWLFDISEVDTKTGLTEREISAIVKMEFINTRVKEDWGIDLKLDNITRSKKTHNISLDREGRKEAFKALTSEKEDDEKGKFRKALGLWE